MPNKASIFRFADVEVRERFVLVLDLDVPAHEVLVVVLDLQKPPVDVGASTRR